ncbi:hypothetical protein C8F04DRAFT_1334014 [Mycena alexandri]|uniref:GLTSCR protein conserved domain-containing protein n=1 Tax=Mycena alexandri TaxID=1745969 RepID=A0AAD6THT1_9AGAR|nr:hypothetical protein C8F04DRAFT_1334014 [Mycena alexandri]
MSKAFQSSFPSSSSSSRLDQPYSTQTFSSAPSSASFSVPSVGRSGYVGNGTWQAPANWSLHPSTPQPPPVKKVRVKKKRALEEEEVIKRTAARVNARLAQDHSAVLNPDTDTPFSDATDVVNRLLPYHVFQQPREDLDRKGKRKADDVAAEIEDTKFALECFKRKRSLEQRFRRIRTRSGKRPAPDEQAVALAQAVLEAERSETTLLNNEIRSSRAELDKIERERRARLQAPPAPQAHYYRPYPFSYQQQPYGQGPVFSVATPATPGGVMSYPQYPPNTAIPVQLPISSLPALLALGIQPVAATTLAPGAAQPPAVLRGSSADGTLLNLEINVSSLQTAQTNGLAIVLNSLMAARPAVAQ